ncbi:hypothetical protein JNK13_05805 [bacterium]|nr:hypothetical protein [bacterium]
MSFGYRSNPIKSLLYLLLSIHLLAVAVDSSLAAPNQFVDLRIYQIMIDRFSDGDLANNNNLGVAPYGFRGGDLRGVIDKLSYIQDLGFNAILLNPIFSGDAPHGYAVKDFFQVDPRFGTLQDYDDLIAAAHQRGMKIFFDLVLNHTSGNSLIFKNHPEWFRPVEKVKSGNEALMDLPWAEATFFTLHDLNQDQAEVYNYLQSVAKFWSQRGIDGFRMDAVTLIEPKFWKKFNAELRKSVKKDFIIHGEIFSTDRERIMRYLPAFNSFFDFPLQAALSDVVIKGHHPVLIKESRMLDSLTYPKDKMRFSFIDNHDLERFPLGANNRLRKLALAFIFTAHGNPTLLYGTEVGLENDPQLSKSVWDKGRSTMNWEIQPERDLRGYVKFLNQLRTTYELTTAERSDVCDRDLPPLYFSIFQSKNKRLIAVYNFSDQVFTNYAFNIQHLLSGPTAMQKLKKELSLVTLTPGENAVIMSDLRGIVKLTIPALSAEFYELQ